MLELILIIGILFLILTFFYKQAVCEFRINQIEWSQVENLSTLLTENVPVDIYPPRQFGHTKTFLLAPASKISLYFKKLR